MKKISTIILITCMFLIGCDSNDESPKSDLNLGISELSFEAGGGVQEIELNLDNPWSATSDKNWCTVEVSGNKLILKAPLNRTISSRTASILITEGEGEGTISITQTGSRFNLFPEKLYISASGKTNSITIQGNIGWKAKADQAWCHLTVDRDTLIVSGDTYSNEQSARYCNITIEIDGEIVRTLPVIQMHRKDFNLENWSETNLGAELPATEVNLSGRQFKQTWGSFYQWGKNVAFPNGSPISTIQANPNLSAALAQNVSEFITCTEDWLIDGSITTQLASANNPYTWTDRAGNDPCQAGYRMPLDYECKRVFHTKPLSYTDKNRKENREILDAVGTEYSFVSIGNGMSKAYVIKMSGTDEAYVIRYEVRGTASYNAWIKITEIKGDAHTDFNTPEEAEALFRNADRSVVRCFPILGVLWCETAEISTPNGCAYWSATPSDQYEVGANAYFMSNAVVDYSLAYRRGLGCLIRGIKK